MFIVEEHTIVQYMMKIVVERGVLKMKKHSYKTFYFWTLKTQNGKIISHSEEIYTGYRNCHSTATKLHKNLKQSTFVQLKERKRRCQSKLNA
jgi:uncharacterized protein YegP (UPF0339 family)